MTVRILQGHVLDRLRTLPDASVHCCVTSPPYWGLRDYGIPPQAWGGDPACPHVELVQRVDVDCRTGTGGNWQQANNGEGLAAGEQRSRFRGDCARANQSKTRTVTTGFCKKCGAWIGSLGLEPTIDLYVEHMVAVFDQVRRVLRKDGTLWLNLGDCYHNGDKGGYCKDRIKAEDSLQAKHQANNFVNWSAPNRNPIPGLKPKDLIGIPWRVAFALQADGWYLRSDIIWNKPNPMPESVTDRPTKAHEYLFLLAKSERYFYDAEAIKESASDHERSRRLREQASGLASVYRLTRDSLPLHNKPGKSGCARSVQARQELALRGTRNARSVWTLPTYAFPEAHFATFPADLARRCLLAGTSSHGSCPTCGAPFQQQRVPVGRSKIQKPKAWPTHDGAHGSFHREGRETDTQYPDRQHYTPGPWIPSCNCAKPAASVPCTVLDPFAGSGTVGAVAEAEGRHSILIELNPEYVAMAKRRTRQLGLFARAP